MATRFISTRIALDGETEFKKQMSEVNGELRTLSSEMKLNEAQFKGQANSMEALTAKDKLLRQEIEQQEEKVRALTQAVEDAEKAYGDTDSRTDKYRQQLNRAKTELIQMNQALDENGTYLDEAQKSSDGCAKSIDGFGKAAKSSKEGLGGMLESLGTLKNAVVGGAVVTGLLKVKDAIFEIVDGTEEYRKIMGTLEVSSQAAGYSAEETGQIYERLYAVLGDTQTAATTTANLQALGLGQEQLAALTDATVGAWARYGDSIPIDSLSEAINETVQVGQVTGTFADVLNWAGENEDAFNAKLAACADASERADLVMRMMAGQGLAEMGQAWMDVNEDIVTANMAQAKWDESMGRLGEVLSPAKNALVELGAGAIDLVASAISGAADLIDYMLTPMCQLPEAAEEAAEGLDQVSEAAQREQEELSLLNGQLNEASEKAEELSTAALALAGAEDTLTAALDEQTESGSLSLNTTMQLIDAGYAAALAIDEETGAVTLNREAYVQIAQAKLDDQIVSMQTQRQSVQTALALNDEALMTLDLAKGYLTAAEARAALEGQETSYSAQIAALEALKGSLGSYSYTAEKAARSVTTATKTAQTQAEKDLARYNELKAELDHEKAMDLVEEKEYYARLSQYRDAYLTDESNLSSYRKVTEELYKYDVELAEQEQALWEEQSDAFLSELEGRVESVRSAQEDMREELAGYGELFQVTDGKAGLEDLQEQIDALNQYEQTMTRLRERGISDSLMTEVLGMGIDDTLAYGEQLLEMTDAQWEEYNALWEEKQSRAAEIAAAFYQEQLNALETEYSDKLGEALGELTDTAFESGLDTVQGLIDGMAEKEQALYDKARAVAEEMARILGGDITQGVSVPSNQQVAQSLSADLSQPTAGGTTTAAATGTGTQSGENFTANLTVTLDGAVVARNQYKYNKREETLRGGSLVEVKG